MPIDPSDPEVREQHRRWLENWKRVGPILEEERWQRLAAMTDEEAQRVTRDLLDLWQPGMKGDDGEGLLLHQRVFEIARRRAGRR